MQHGQDLTQGNVGRQLLRFSLPFLLSMLFQALYALIDMIIIGQYYSHIPGVPAGVNNALRVSLLVTNLVGGFVQGGSVMISQYRGAKRPQDEREAIGTLFTASAIGGVLLTVVMLLLAAPIIDAIGTAKEARPSAISFLTIILSGTLFTVGFNAITAVYRGIGDSVRPLIFAAVSCGINIGLDFLFIAGFNWAAAGAAWATVISQAAALLFAVLWMKRADFSFQFRRKEFIIQKQKLFLLFKIGFPSSMQNTLVGLSFIFITGIVNSIDAGNLTNINIFGFSDRINNFAILPNMAISLAVGAMVAQNMGARSIDRAKRTQWAGLRISVAMAAVTIAVVNLFPGPILGAFSTDPLIIKYGVTYLRFLSINYMLTAISFNFNGLFIGAGHTGFALFSALCGAWLFRVPTAMLFAHSMGMEGVAWGMNAAVLGQLTINIIYYLSKRWQKPVIKTSPIAQT